MNKHKYLLKLLVALIIAILLLIVFQKYTPIKMNQNNVPGQSASVFSWKQFNKSPRGVYVAWFSSESIPNFVLSSPDVSGIFLRYGWNNLEKNGDDLYNWQKLDSQIDQIYNYNIANGTNLKISIGVMAGKNTPTWVDATRETFSEIPLDGTSNVLLSYSVPAPYDPEFKIAFNDFIKDFADHLKASSDKYNLISAIKVTGVNTSSAELRLPDQESLVSQNGAVTSADNVAIWQGLGYRPSLVKSVFRSYLKNFANNFPGITLSTSIIPGDNAFPRIDENGNKYAEGLLEDITLQLLRYGFNTFPNQFAIQYNGLSQSVGQSTLEYMDLAKENGAIWGYQLTQQYFDDLACVDITSQTASNCDPTNFSTAMNHAIDDGASFVEIFAENLIAFPAVVQNVNQVLNSSSPRVPTDIRLSDLQGNSATLKWKESRDFEFDLLGYDIYGSATGYSSKINASVIGTNTYTINNLLPATTYIFKIKAIDLAGNESPLSQEIVFTTKDIQAPSAPSGISLITAKPNYAIINIANHALDDTGVYRYLIIRNGVHIGKMLGSVNNYIDYNVSPGMTYNYIIKAIDKSGNVSPASNKITINTPALSGNDNVGPVLNFSMSDGTKLNGSKSGFFGSTDSQSGVGPVAVLIDEVQVFTSTVKASNYVFDTNMFVDGEHMIQVMAFDASPNGNMNSSARQIIINNTAQ